MKPSAIQHTRRSYRNRQSGERRSVHRNESGRSSVHARNDQCRGPGLDACGYAAGDLGEADERERNRNAVQRDVDTVGRRGGQVATGDAEVVALTAGSGNVLRDERIRQTDGANAVAIRNIQRGATDSEIAGVVEISLQGGAIVAEVGYIRLAGEGC